MIQKKYKKWIGSIILISLILLFIGRRIVFTQTSTNYQIQKDVIDKGGAASQSNSYQVFDAVGQPSPVSVTSSGYYIVSSGFLGSSIIVSAVTEADDVAIPDEFKLCQNYPNPFNPETTIEYHLPRTSAVILTIYDLQGHQVRRLVNGTKSAGYHKIQWDGKNDAGQKSASGIYLCRIHAKTYNSDPHTYIGCKKMLLLK